MISKICKFSAFSLEFQKFFSITRTIFSHSRSEQFWQQNTIVQWFNQSNVTFMVPELTGQFIRCNNQFWIPRVKSISSLIQLIDFRYNQSHSRIKFWTLQNGKFVIGSSELLKITRLLFCVLASLRSSGLPANFIRLLFSVLASLRSSGWLLDYFLSTVYVFC